MRTSRTTSLNDCIKRMAEGDSGAATVLALVVKERPDQALRYLRALDEQEIYGRDIWNSYAYICSQNLEIFLLMISRKNLKEALKERRR